MPHCNKQMISLFLTTKCNLRCVYCYNSEERDKMPKQTLSLEIAKAGIDEYFKDNCGIFNVKLIDPKSRHVRFYGPGEPTQAFSLMQEITEYAKQKGNKKGYTITTELQTNGVFSKEVREWMLNNINIMWISFDGMPDIQDNYRPFGYTKDNKKIKSSPFIEENVKWLNANKGNRDLMIGARVTMTNDNINRQIEMVDYFNSLGIKYIWTDPIFPEVKELPVCEDLERDEDYHFDMKIYVDNFIEANEYAKNIGISYESILTCNFDGESTVSCRACTPLPHLTTDGYLSACDMALTGENAYHMDCFIYGKWDKQTKQFMFYKEKIKALQDRNVDNDKMKHCKNCEDKLRCGGYCLGEVANESGNLYGQKIDYHVENLSTCDAIRLLYKKFNECNTFNYMHP